MTLFDDDTDPLARGLPMARRGPSPEELARSAVVAQPAAQRMNDTYQQLKAQICEQVIDQLEARNLTRRWRQPACQRDPRANLPRPRCDLRQTYPVRQRLPSPRHRFKVRL